MMTNIPEWLIDTVIGCSIDAIAHTTINLLTINKEFTYFLEDLRSDGGFRRRLSESLKVAINRISESNPKIPTFLVTDRNLFEDQKFRDALLDALKKPDHLDVSQLSGIDSSGIGKYEYAVYVSYSWGSESELTANELDAIFAKRGIHLVRDKKDLEYKGSIKEFQQRIGQGQCIILIISERYLHSEHCMNELVEIEKNEELRKRIFPIILNDARIYKPIDRLKYIQYWDEQINQLNKAIKQVDVMSNLGGITANLDKYTRIRNEFDHLTDLLSDLNALTPEIHAANGFLPLVNAVESVLIEAQLKRQHMETPRARLEFIDFAEKHFAEMLPAFSGRAAISRTVVLFLNYITEAVWMLPEFSGLYGLMFQKMNIEDIQDQIQIAKARINAIKAMNENLRVGLLLLIDEVGKSQIKPLNRLLSSSVNTANKTDGIGAMYPDASEIIVRKLSPDKAGFAERWLGRFEHTEIFQEILTAQELFIGPGTTMFYMFVFCGKHGMKFNPNVRIVTTNALITGFLETANSPLINKVEVLGDKLLREYYSYYFSSDAMIIPKIDLAIIGIAGLGLTNESFDLRTCWAEQAETVRRVLLETRQHVVVLADSQKLMISEGNPFLNLEEIQQNCHDNPRKRYSILVDSERPDHLNFKFDENRLMLTKVLGKPDYVNGFYTWSYPAT